MSGRAAFGPADGSRRSARGTGCRRSGRPTPVEPTTSTNSTVPRNRSGLGIGRVPVTNSSMTSSDQGSLRSATWVLRCRICLLRPRRLTGERAVRGRCRSSRRPGVLLAVTASRAALAGPSPVAGFRRPLTWAGHLRGNGCLSGGDGGKGPFRLGCRGSEYGGVRPGWGRPGGGAVAGAPGAPGLLALDAGLCAG